MKRALVLLVAATALSTTCQPIDERTTTQVDAVFADVDSTTSPGAAVAIVRGTDVLYMNGYGMANLEHGVPITPQTIFDIASISKQFAAMTAILLEQEGAIDFDEAAAATVDQLPDFGETVTLRHLLHHTSGIRDWPHVMQVAGVQFGDVISFEKIKKMLFRQRDLNFSPGSQYAYSNTGYNLLAEVLARRSGKSFRELTEERLFVPLEMTHTHFSDDHEEIVVGRAASYEPDGGGFKNSTNQLTALASSSLNTTMEDFTKWMINFETKDLGGPAGLEQLQERGVLTTGETIPYALGVRHDVYRVQPTVGHSGSWRGFRTGFVRFPEQHFSVAVFCNFSTCDPATRIQSIADIYLADVLRGDRPAIEEQTAPPPDHPMSEDALEAFAGNYYSPELDTTYELVVAEGRLRADHWRNDSVFLRPVGEQTFEGDAWWFRDVVFSRDETGAVRGFGLSGDRVMDLRFDRRED